MGWGERDGRHLRANRLRETIAVSFDALVSMVLGLDVKEGPDSDLVLRVLESDPEATTTLVRRFSGRIFGLAYRLTGNAAEAEDLCQEVLMRVLDGLPRFDRLRPLEPWVRRIAVRHVLNRLERGPRRREAPLETTEAALRMKDPRPDPAVAFETTERDRLLNEALARLPERQRLAVALKYQEDLTSEEISELMGVPRNTVKTWILRARELLRKELSGAL